MIIAFDLDGTIAETMSGLASIAISLIAPRYPINDAYLAHADYFKTIGVPFEQQLEELFPADPRNPVDVETFNQRRLDVYTTARPVRGAVAALALAADIAEIWVISSTPHDVVWSWINRLNLARFVNHIPWSGTKLEQLQSAMSSTDDEVLFVGDAPRDYHFAKQAGCRFVGVTHTVGKNDFVRGRAWEASLARTVLDVLLQEYELRFV